MIYTNDPYTLIPKFSYDLVMKGLYANGEIRPQYYNTPDSDLPTINDKLTYITKWPTDSTRQQYNIKYNIIYSSPESNMDVHLKHNIASALYYKQPSPCNLGVKRCANSSIATGR